MGTRFIQPTTLAYGRGPFPAPGCRGFSIKETRKEANDDLEEDYVFADGDGYGVSAADGVKFCKHAFEAIAHLEFANR